MNRKDILAILTLTVLVVFFFADVLFTDLTFVYRDFSRYFYPLYQYGVSCLKAGILPLWNPYNYSGMPFLALIQLAIFYPLSIILYLFPFVFSIKLFIVTHYLMAGVFTYFLMRHWNLDISSALISSITYAFGGYLLSCVDLTNTLISAAWVPAIFFLYSKALKQKGLGWTAWTGVALGIQILGGDPVVFYLTLLVLFSFTCLYFSINSFFKYILAVTLSLGLTLFQTIPFWELTSLSARAKGLGIWEAGNWSLSKYEILNLICPFFSNANHFAQQRFFESLYPGILPFFLASMAIFLKKYRKLIVFWGIISISFITMSLGKDFVVYKFLYSHLPLFNMIRYPIKSFCIIHFSLSILAGFGFKFLLDSLHRRVRFVFLLPLFILTGICLSCWIFTCIHHKEFFLFKVVSKPIYNYLYCPLTGIFLLSLISFLICVVGKIRAGVFSFAAIGLIILDLITFGGGLNPVIDQNLYTYVPPAVQLLKKEAGLSRFLLNSTTEKRYRFIACPSFVEEFRNSQSVLVPNLGLNYRLFDANGYEAIPIHDYDRLMYYVNSEGLPKALISMINVKYILSEEPILNEGIRPIRLIKDGDRIIRLYENPDVLSRAYLVSEVRVVKERKKVFKALCSIDPTKEIIVEEGFTVHGSRFTVQKSTVKIVDYQPNKVILTGFSPTDQILFLSDAYYPGWKAYLDGQETKIYRANYIFRAIKFPAGEHQVEFIYSPMSFKIGLLGSMLTLILLVVVVSGVRLI